MTHIKEISSLIEGLPDVVLFIVGASPITDRFAVSGTLRRTYKSCSAFKYIPHFYLQGGVQMDRLDRYERFLLHLVASMIKINPFVRKDIKEKTQRMTHSADFSNKDNICALVEYVKAGR